MCLHGRGLVGTALFSVSAALTARLSTTARHRRGYGCDLSLTAWNDGVPAADRASPGVSQAEIVTRPGWTESKQTQPGTSGPEERQIGRRAAALPQQHICGLRSATGHDWN